MSTSSPSHILQKEFLLRSQRDATKYQKNRPNIASNQYADAQYNTSQHNISQTQWNENMSKPYRQSIEHELIIDFWARNVKLFQNHSIAGILIYLITNYSVPAFKFRYGNEKKIRIYNEGLVCHQLYKTKCSVLFGPRLKYSDNGLDANMIYTFKFNMLSGNIGIGICANDYTKWNTLLHSVNNLRSSIIWKNGYYYYNKFGTNNRNSVTSGYIDDIFKDNDQIQLKVNLISLTCSIRNLTNKRIPRHELPMKDLVKYKGATGYLQIVIGFFDDFGATSWVKGAACIEIVEQRGEHKFL